MALDSKKAACFLKNGVTVLSVFCYRFVRKHPFISSLFFSFGLLYEFYPKVFFFLVSSSPVLISTALLLGTLLSLGQPHIPQIDELDEEEEENLEVARKGLHEDDNDEKKSNNIKETTGDDHPHMQSTDDDDDDSNSVVADVPVTTVTRRRFEEGIDDFSTKRYIDAETLLGRRTEIVETIEEGDEQFNVEDDDASEDQIRHDAPVESVDFISAHKREVEGVASIENKEAEAAFNESEKFVETSLEKEAETMAPGEDISEKTGEEATLEVAEGHGIQYEVRKEETEMQDHAKSVSLSDTDIIVDRSLEKSMKEIEEEMPLLGHPSSSSPELHEGDFHLRTVDIDSSEESSKLKGLNDEVKAKPEGELEVEVSGDAEENSHKASLDNIFSLSMRSSWKKLGHHRTPSDSGSDAAESLSSDASLGQLDPMFDEHHPLLAYDGSKAGSVSNSSVDEGFHEEPFTPRERVSEDFIAFPEEPLAPSDVHEEEEEEEEEAAHDFGFTWTEDDEKNLRDLGMSERERMEQEERLIANLHVQHPQGSQEDNLIDFYAEERASFLEEENLVEIGVAGETAAKEAIAIHSESVDHQLDKWTDSASKEIPLEMCFDSTSREIPAKFHSDLGHEEETTDVQFDQLGKENPIEFSEEKSSTDHLDMCMQSNLQLLEDQSQPLEDACLAETNEEKTNIEVSSVEEIESSSRSVTAENTSNNNEQIQVCSPTDVLQSIETVEAAILDSSSEFQMHKESIHADVAPVEEEKPTSQKEAVPDDDLSSSSSSVNEIELSAMDTTAEEPATVHEEFEISSPKDIAHHSEEFEISSLKDIEHHSEDVEANEVCFVPVMEIERETIVTVAEVLPTEEHESRQEESKEPSEDSISSESNEIKLMTRDVIAEESAITEEEIQVGSPMAFVESTDMVGIVSRDAPLATEILTDNLTTVEEEVLSENQQEKMEATYDDSGSSASDEIDLETMEIIAQESVHKHEIAQVESLNPGEQQTEAVGATEDDSGMDREIQRGMTSTEEQESTEEKNDKHIDDSGSSAAEDTESTSSEFIQEELPSKHEEFHDVSPKTSHGSTKIEEAADPDSLPEVEMLGDSLLTAEKKDISEAQESKSEETRELYDDMSFSAANIDTSENQEELIMLDVKSKEELGSAFEHAVSNELDNKYEESQSVSPKANQESTATFEPVEQDSNNQMHMLRNGFGEDGSSEKRHPAPEKTLNTSDDSSSSASDISSLERLEELTSLEVNSKEQIEAALKEALAEELANKHEEVQVTSSQASEPPTETVESTELVSPPVIDMQRDNSPAAAVVASTTEEHQSKPKKTEESHDDLRSAEMEVSKSPSSDGGEIQ